MDATERTLPREEETQVNETSGRRLDPELRVLGAMLRQLDDLDDAARSRVVLYLTARYVGATLKDMGSR